MLEEASKNAVEKNNQKCEDVEHKIETLKLKQEKIKDLSKYYHISHLKLFILTLA